MPYWPIPMTISALLLLAGLRYGGWVAPLIVFAAYASMRLLVSITPASLIEVAGCTLWLVFAFLLCYKGAWVPGFFYTLSGLTYPALLLVGFRIEYMGLSPIIAAVFGLLALAGMGGGIFAMAIGPHMDSSRFLCRLPTHTLGVATR